MARYAGLVLVNGLRPHVGPFGPPKWVMKIKTKDEEEEEKLWFVLSDKFGL